MKARRNLHEGIALVLTVSILLLGGCTGDSLTSIEEEVAETPALKSVTAKHAQNSARYDVGGSWKWSREEHLTFPAWAAQGIFGILPEGPTTSARCEGSGTMTLVQVGSTFTGLSDNTAHECVTKGGQVFQDPEASTTTTIADGELHGRSLRMLLDNEIVDCRYHAAIKDVEGNTAVVLEGGGTCIIPGHPQSEAPIALDPPPAGTSKALSFTAVRQ